MTIQFLKEFDHVSRTGHLLNKIFFRILDKYVHSNFKCRQFSCTETCRQTKINFFKFTIFATRLLHISIVCKKIYS